MDSSQPTSSNESSNSGTNINNNNNNNIHSSPTAAATATTLLDDLDFGSDDKASVRRAAFTRLQTTISSLADFEGHDAVRLVHDDQVAAQDVLEVNSIVFQVLPNNIIDNDGDETNDSVDESTVVVVLPASKKVDLELLEQHLLQGKDDDERVSVRLVPCDVLESVCGFMAGTVPPLGHVPRTLRTIVDTSLADSLSLSSLLLQAGGGHPDCSCLIRIDTLLKMEGTELGDVAVRSGLYSNGNTNEGRNRDNVNSKGYRFDDDNDNDDACTVSLQDGVVPTIPARPKSFFPYTPPDLAEAERCVADPERPIPMKPQDVTILGRINGVRRMSKRLVFVDIAPPDYVGTGSREDCLDLPWKSACDGQDMAVQLIAGKTLCKNLGDVDGPAALKQFRFGQLVLVRGRTNVGNRSSLKNWYIKRSLDVVVFGYDLLSEDISMAVLLGNHHPNVAQKSNSQSKTDKTAGGSSTPTTTPTNAPLWTTMVQRQQRDPPSPMMVQRENSSLPTKSSAELRRLQLAASIQSSQSVTGKPNGNMAVDYLKVSDVYGDDHKVTVVDSLETIEYFSQDVISLLHKARPLETGTIAGVVGIDCEWKPSFLMATQGERQPVLLLQIALQPSKNVYLFDLQTMVRPCLAPSEPMNKLEQRLSDALSELFASEYLVKVGFQLTADLRKLTSSYPHVEALRLYHSVADVGGIARKSMQLGRVRNSRDLSSSLAKLTRYLMKKPLDKEQQVSDWSVRPLSAEQMEYASLDAVVTPVLFEKCLDIVEAGWIEGKLQVGRRKDDPSFDKSISSTRFLFLEDDDPTTVRKLKAKKAVGSPYVVTQTWVTGSKTPDLPSAPANDGIGAFTDINGVRKIPSLGLSLNNDSTVTAVKELVGSRLGKSKDRCLESLLADHPEMPDGSRLDYHHRSGYVEFQDGVALFVNMPKRIGEKTYGGYPNLWLNGGRRMSWFLRENEWNGGTSDLGRKLLGKLPATNGELIHNNDDNDGANDTTNGSSGTVNTGSSLSSLTSVGTDAAVATAKPISVLFVRMGKGDFLACGRCRVEEGTNPQTEGNDWGLVELHLELLEWNNLQQCKDFLSMVTAAPDDAKDSDDSVANDVAPSKLQENNNDGIDTTGVNGGETVVEPAALAARVIEGDVLGAILSAVSNAGIAPADRSITLGKQVLVSLLRDSDCESKDAALAVLQDPRDNGKER